MKFKEYFNNLEKYWSANFLALLSSVFCLFFVTRTVMIFIYYFFQAVNFSEYIELVCKTYPFGLFYSVIFFPASCFLAVYISIFYIFVIISQKRWFIFVSVLLILISGSKYFALNDVVVNAPFGSGLHILFYYIPMTIVTMLISIGIYIVLLLLELIPKFRVPKSIVSQNNIFKKYVQIFYWIYFILVCDIIYILIYVITYSSTPRY